MTKTSDRKPEPATVSLAVYGARAEEEGDVWNKDYGLLFVPDGWEWLPSGDAYLTRTVKKLGPAWVLRKPNRKRRYTATLGVYAPAGNILRAKALAAETRAPREKRREVSARTRARNEEKYRADFRRAVLDYLDFAPEHAGLAAEIADGVVDHACPVGSGTVARTRRLDLEEKARLAVNAYVRHRHTGYEARLGGPYSGFDREHHHLTKALAGMEAREFLEEHRRAPQATADERPSARAGRRARPQPSGGAVGGGAGGRG